MLYLTQRGSLMRSYIGVLFKKGQHIFLGKKRTQRDTFIRIDELEKKNACHFRYRRSFKMKDNTTISFLRRKKYLKEKY